VPEETVQEQKSTTKQEGRSAMRKTLMIAGGWRPDQHCADHQSIHDTALAFAPRIVVTFVIFLIVFPWMMNTMISYAHTLLVFSALRAMSHAGGQLVSYRLIHWIGQIPSSGRSCSALPAASLAVSGFWPSLIHLFNGGDLSRVSSKQKRK
jgi:hypothetical protein